MLAEVEAIKECDSQIIMNSGFTAVKVRKFIG